LVKRIINDHCSEPELDPIKEMGEKHYEKESTCGRRRFGKKKYENAKEPKELEFV
jgi:hypothetical protein